MKTSIKKQIDKHLKQVDRMAVAVRAVQRSASRAVASCDMSVIQGEYERIMRLPKWKGRCLPHCFLIEVMSQCGDLKTARAVSGMIKGFPPNCPSVLQGWIASCESDMYERLGDRSGSIGALNRLCGHERA